MTSLTRSIIVPLSLILAFICDMNAQDFNCTFGQEYKAAIQSDGSLRSSHLTFEEAYQEFIRSGEFENYSNTSFLNLPLVFHIVHEGDSLGSVSNPRDETILELIELTNDYFRQSNSNIDFDNPNYGADTQISFCLASVNEEGVPASGIVRHYDSGERLISLFPLLWDREKYINVFLWEMNGCGAYFFRDEIITIWNQCYIGSSNLAHELGHYLSLQHTFFEVGDCENGDCLASGDFVCDTPPQKNSDPITQDGFENDPCLHPGNSCFSDEEDTSEHNPYRSVDLGGMGDQPDANNNIMGYAGPCKTDFSQGQVSRMKFRLLRDKPDLFDQEVTICSVPLVTQNDAGIEKIEVKATDECDQNVDISFTLKNYGENQLTDVDIILFHDEVKIDSLHWSGVLNSGEEETILFGNYTTEFGQNLYEISTFHPNNTLDGDPNTDRNFSNFYTYGLSKNVLNNEFLLSCDFEDKSIGLDIIGDVLGFQYHWTNEAGLSMENGNGLPMLNISKPREYTLHIYNPDYSCEWLEKFSVLTTGLTAANADVFGYGLITCETPTVTLTSNSSSFFVTKYWYTRDGIIPNATGRNLEVDSAGDYRLKIVEDFTGCTVFGDWFHVSSSVETPRVDLKVDGVLSCNEQSLLIDTDGSEFDSNRYKYLLRKLNPTSIIFDTVPVRYLRVEEPGTYELEVLNISKNCSSKKQIQVSLHDEVPNVIIEGPTRLDTISNETVYFLDASKSDQGTHYTYTWSTQNGNILEVENTLQPKVKGFGKYTIEIVDTISGCSQRNSFSFMPKHILSAYSFCIPSLYSGPFIELEIEDENGLVLRPKWSTPGGGTLYSVSLYPYNEGVHYVEYAVGNSLVIDSFDFQLKDFNIPIAQIDQDEKGKCTENGVKLSAENSTMSEGSTLIWRDDLNSVIGEGLEVYVKQAGRYSLDILGEYAGCWDTTSIDVHFDDDHIDYANAGQDLFMCNGESISIGQNSPNKNHEFAWYLLEAKDTLYLSSESRLTTDTPGKYLLEMLDKQNGCATQDVVEVNNLSLNLNTEIEKFLPPNFCTEYNTVFRPTNLTSYSNYKVEWTLPSGEQREQLFLPASLDGLYTMEFSLLQSNCTLKDSLQYIQPNTFTTDNEIWDVSCNSGSDGQINLSPAGGVPPYRIEGGQFNINGLSAGSYQFEISDDVDCTSLIDIEILEPTPLQISDIVSINNSLSIEVSGGTPPYSYRWSNGEDNQQISELQFGETYKVSITDSNGCEINASHHYFPQDESQAVTVLPNPSSDQIQVFVKESTARYELKIIDTLGKCVLTIDEYRSLDHIDISTLGAGLYHAVLSNEEFNLVRKFIKNHL